MIYLVVARDFRQYAYYTRHLQPPHASAPCRYVATWKDALGYNPDTTRYVLIGPAHERDDFLNIYEAVARRYQRSELPE